MSANGLSRKQKRVFAFVVAPQRKKNRDMIMAPFCQAAAARSRAVSSL